MRFRLTEHAVDRYVERVKPALGRIAARQELEVLLLSATVHDRPPVWKPPVEDGAPRWCELSDGIACPVTLSGVVVSVFIRSTMPDEMRRRRNEKNSRHRAAKRRKNGPRGRPPLSRIEDEAWPT